MEPDDIVWSSATAGRWRIIEGEVQRIRGVCCGETDNNEGVDAGYTQGVLLVELDLS